MRVLVIVLGQLGLPVAKYIKENTRYMSSMPLMVVLSGFLSVESCNSLNW